MKRTVKTWLLLGVWFSISWMDASGLWAETRYLFSSESVTEGHPDKICDQISDAILDVALSQDPNSHVACETLASLGMVVVTGEVTTKASIDYAATARGVLRTASYAHPGSADPDGP